MPFPFNRSCVVLFSFLYLFLSSPLFLSVFLFPSFAFLLSPPLFSPSYLVSYFRPSLCFLAIPLSSFLFFSPASYPIFFSSFTPPCLPSFPLSIPFLPLRLTASPRFCPISHPRPFPYPPFLFLHSLSSSSSPPITPDALPLATPSLPLPFSLSPFSSLFLLQSLPLSLPSFL